MPLQQTSAGAQIDGGAPEGPVPPVAAAQTQTPPTQVLPFMHAGLQPPLLGVHTLFWQISPVAQPWPQLPQLAESEVTSAHVAPPEAVLQHA